MIEVENPTTMKNCSTNLQKVFQNILTVVLLDVKNQFTYRNIDPTIENLQNVLESSVTTKFQEEEFLTLHLKDFENSVAAENTINDESLIYEKSILENKLRETQDKYDMDIKSKMKVIDSLRRDLKEKEDILKDSMKSYDNFVKSNQELSNAKESAEKLDNENKHLKHKLKCMECKFEALKKSCIGEKVKKPKVNIEVLNTAADDVLNNEDKHTTEDHVTEEKTNPIETEPQQRKEKTHGKDVNILEDSLNLSTLNSQVELLTEQIDKLKLKKIQVEDDIDVKEGKIISLQSTIDKMKIIILQCKTKEHNLSLQLEYANVTIDKLQRTISNLKKEKDVIHKDAEKYNQKSTYMENQWDRIVTMSNNKNEKIESLQKEKNAVLHKIKEKNKLLSEKDIEQKTMKNDLDEAKQKYIKLYKGMDKLRTSYNELEKRCELLQYERECLEKKLMEREYVGENQLSYFLRQLDVSEDEMKGEFSKSVEGMDASDVAQKIINKRRNELSSLKSNMCWMKEALEVSGKDRLDLQSQLSEREEELSNLHAKLSMFEETNKHLNASLVMHQADTTSLHQAVQNAVVSYDGVCSLFEKQEKALQNERDTYNSEIMELQDKLKKKSNSKPISALHPVKSGIQFSDDLRFILNNIKDQLSSTLYNMNSKLEKEVQNLSNATQTFNTSIFDSGTELHEDTTLTNSTRTSVHENLASNLSVGSNTQKLNQYLEMHNSVVHSDVTQSMCQSMNSDKTLTDQSKSMLYSSMYVSSEKEDSLRMLSDTSQSSKIIQNSSNVSVYPTSDNSVCVQKTSDSNSENNAVQKLQEKLSQLHQMGTHLKTNNTELTEMMKTHSKKLKMLKNKASENK